MTPEGYRKLVRSSAIYDLIVTVLFALPVVAAYKIGLFHLLHVHFQLAGTFPEFSPLHLMFVNLMGAIITVWSVLRIANPDAKYGFYDAIGRLMFSTIMAYYLLVANVSALIWLFLIPEFAWCIFQFFGYWQASQTVEK